METIIKLELPLKRVAAPKRDQYYGMLPWHARWFGWLIDWGGGSVGEFGGSRVNTTWHLMLFRRVVMTIHRNEYHDRSDAERAAEYLRKWAADEKELRNLRLLVLGDATGAEVKRLIKESLGVDLDEGRIL